jgi:hypothetical protein
MGDIGWMHDHWGSVELVAFGHGLMDRFGVERQRMELRAVVLGPASGVPAAC